MLPSVTGGRRKDTDTQSSAPALAAGRGVERQVAAPTLAGLLFLGAAMGLVNLFVDGVLREGAPVWVYGGTMVSLVVLGVWLAFRRRVGRRETFGLVLLGDLAYVVIAMCLEDPVRHAPPLMLLFCAFVAAWFLVPWMLGVNMAVTVLACLLAMWGSYDSPLALAVQVGVNAGVLNAASAGVYVLRQRVQRLLEATRALSHQDPLTGLSNRRFLVEQAPRVWRQARREGARVAAMVLDLDHFKQLNDAHGHAAGDRVLVEIAARLREAARDGDLVARWGGEEFLAVLPGVPADQVVDVLERMRAAVSFVPLDTGSTRLRVTASLGAVRVPWDAGSAADALRLADALLYSAKESGRDRVAIGPAAAGG